MVKRCAISPPDKTVAQTWAYKPLLSSWAAHRRYAPSLLCSKTLLKTQGAPPHSRCGGDDCLSNTPQLIQSGVARKLWSTNPTRCQKSNVAKGQHSNGHPSDHQPECCLQ